MVKESNSFNTVIDLTNLDWSQSRSSEGTDGTYLKTTAVENGIKYYFKLSQFSVTQGFLGTESLNELIAFNISRWLGLRCADCILQYATVRVFDKTYDTLVYKSRSYKSEEERTIALDAYCRYNNISYNEVLSEDFLNGMFILDFIIYNRDRHGANIELSISSDGKFREAPLFDHGISLTFNKLNVEDILEFNSRSDLIVNNYVGSRSLLQNLNLVTVPIRVDKFIGIEEVFKGCPTQVSEDLKLAIYIILEDRIRQALENKVLIIGE